MDKKILSFLFSMRLMGALIFIFAVSIGTATFIENDYGTTAAKAVVYNATWFEVLLILLSINLIGNLFKKKYFTKGKLTIFIFHLAFLVIIVGAGITRYISYEGVMHIRMGQQSNIIVSDNTYLQIKANDLKMQYTYDKQVLFSVLSDNSFNEKVKFEQHDISIDYVDFVPRANYVVKEGEGEAMLSLVTTTGNGRENVYVKEGETKDVGFLKVSWNDATDTNAVRITSQGDQFYFESPFDVQYMKMLDQSQGLLPADTLLPFEHRTLYNIAGISVVFQDYYANARLELESMPKEEEQYNKDALKVDIAVNGKHKEVVLFGQKGVWGEHQQFTFNGVNFDLAYGAKPIVLPFALKLDKFKLERYPGSMSPSSFESEVTLIDPNNNVNEPHKIFMNNVLDYQGYRFFQSSYDQDEQGTILSVNHDYYGTMVTYIGYLLMALAMILSIFNKNSRFGVLNKKIKDVRKAKTALNVLLLGAVMVPSLAFGQLDQFTDTTSAKNQMVDYEHARKFGALVVQDNGGRLKPINTLASEVLRKVYRKDEYEGMHADQVFLEMTMNPLEWQVKDIIKVRHPKLQKELGEEGKAYWAFFDFFDEDLNYILSGPAEEAHQKKPFERSQYDKDVIAVDERVNICYLIYAGTLLKIFPIPNDEANRWTSSFEPVADLTGDDSLLIQGLSKMYFLEVHEAKQSGDWTQANKLLEHLSEYQHKYGAAVIPSERKLSMEIKYNDWKIFKRLFSYYSLVGFVLLILLFLNVFKANRIPKLIIRIVIGVLLLGFVGHTLGLIGRWYISGHAPWSNAYESMLYIAWATMLAGFVFARKSPITLSITAILASLILMVANLNWLDPEVTNLVPVLKSYWLMIHVAIITASYGFLGLGALLGFLNLVTMLLKSKKNAKRLNLTIRELTHINEMTMTIGLFMLTIGTFLGGVWANESWGRYWGWDPKETWALTSVLVYAFVLHMRFLPGVFKSNYTFNLASVLGYGAIIMTYFGVNYYLSGLHSYAAGDPMPIPTFVYYTLAVIGLVAIVAAWNNRRLKQKPA